MDASAWEMCANAAACTCGVLRAWVVWYGMVWYGMVWYGMVWYGPLVDVSVDQTSSSLLTYTLL